MMTEYHVSYTSICVCHRSLLKTNLKENVIFPVKEQGKKKQAYMYMHQNIKISSIHVHVYNLIEEAYDYSPNYY